LTIFIFLYNKGMNYEQLLNNEVMFHTWPVTVDIKSTGSGYEVIVLKDSVTRMAVTIPSILPAETNETLKDIKILVPANNIYCVTAKRDMVFPLDLCDLPSGIVVTHLECLFNLHVKEDGYLIMAKGNKPLTCCLTKSGYQDIQNRQKGD
jgi:hypothetical protein